MKRFAIPEFGKIPRRELGPRLTNNLQAFDEGFAKKNSETVFDWSRRHDVVAKNYVGVVQVPGLVVEILPKVDWIPNGSLDDSARDHRAQSNLLYMLSLTRKLPIRERDLANLTTSRQPLLEALVELFAIRLLEELRKGADHSYVRRRENLTYIRGRLLVEEQLFRNIGHRERTACEYDDFLPDTWLNRVLKAACVRLLLWTQSSWTERCLREAILHLANVRDLQIRAEHFSKIHLNRNNERFEDLVVFGQIVLLDTSPAPQHGDKRSFSLLFPMESVFEEFIGECVRRYAPEFGLERSEVRLQAKGRRRWLLREKDSETGRFRLKPDIYVGDAHRASLIVDTKWKKLVPDSQDPRNGVAQADLYQLYAYAERYGCADNVLLYPAVPGAMPTRYRVDGGAYQAIRVEIIDVSRDLYRERVRFRRELCGAVVGDVAQGTGRAATTGL